MYLVSLIAQASRVSGLDGGSVETLWFEGSHGEMMLYPRWVRLIAQKVALKVYGLGAGDGGPDTASRGSC